MAPRLGFVVVASLLSAATAAAQQDAQQLLRRELRRAEVLERAGRLSQALDVLDSLLQASPAEPGAILAVERIYRQQGQLERLLPLLERAVHLDPGSALLRQVQLRVLADLDRGDELAAAGEDWVRSAPRTRVAYREYAAALRGTGRLEEAETVLKRGREQLDRPAAFAPELASLYLEQRRWAAAADEWRRLLRESPGLAWELISHELRTLGPNAENAARATLELLADDLSIEGQQLAAIAALYAGRPGEARDRAEALLDELSERERRALLAGFSRLAADRVQPALVAWAYRHLLRYAAEDVAYWDLAREIVRHDLSAGDTAAALALLDEFLEGAEPGSAGHRWASAMQVRLYAAQAEAERAERALQRHAGLYTGAELPELALAVAEADLGRDRLRETRNVLELVPEGAIDASLAARLSATRAYLALYAGNYDEARSRLEIAAAGLSGEPRSEALRLLGFLRDGVERELQAVAAAHRLVLRGRPLEASRRLADGLARATPSGARPALLLWAGELAIAGGSLEAGEEMLRRVLELYPGSGEAPVALLLLAEALAASARPAEAVALLEQLILGYPESAMAPIGRRRLAELREEVSGS
ncbi:MAG: hypothetical protein JSV41_13270 [Gemmatimonadota bacterium]|nr:MAG: hypothetical protein JSV41_13270 [Gemmatimonadota bacterium]